MISPEINHCRSIRLKEYDYSSAGAYFVTVCTKGRRCFFGEIKSGEMGLKAFQKKFPHAKALLVGKNGIPLDEFLCFEISYWVEKVQ